MHMDDAEVLADLEHRLVGDHAEVMTTDLLNAWHDAYNQLWQTVVHLNATTEVSEQQRYIRKIHQLHDRTAAGLGIFVRDFFEESPDTLVESRCKVLANILQWSESDRVRAINGFGYDERYPDWHLWFSSNEETEAYLLDLVDTFGGVENLDVVALTTKLELDFHHFTLGQFQWLVNALTAESADNLNGSARQGRVIAMAERFKGMLSKVLRKSS